MVIFCYRRGITCNYLFGWGGLSGGRGGITCVCWVSGGEELGSRQRVLVVVIPFALLQVVR